MSLPEAQDSGNLMNGFQGYDQSHEDFISTCIRCRKSTDAATKIGFGGFVYVARVLGMIWRTIYTGIGELEAMGNEDHPPHSVPVAVPSASAVLAVVVAKSPNANRGWGKW